MSKVNLSLQYAVFNEYLEKMYRSHGSIPSFSQVCHSLGVDEYIIEEYLYRELGVSGDELLDFYQD